MEFINKFPIFSKFTNIASGVNNEQISASLFLLLVVVGFLLIKSPRQYKDKQDNPFLKDEEVAKATNEARWKQRTISFIFFSAALFLIYTGASYFFAIISVVGAAAAIAIREELADIFVGILMRSSLMKTAVKIGDEIIISDKFGEDVLKVAQVNVFKTMLLNQDTNEYVSIRNTLTLRETVRHIVLEGLQHIKIETSIDSEISIEKLEKDLVLLLDKELQSDIYVQGIDPFKSSYPYVKSVYGVFPRVKNRYSIFYKYINKGEISLSVEFNIGLASISKQEATRGLFKIIQGAILEQTPKPANNKTRYFRNVPR